MGIVEEHLFQIRKELEAQLQSQAFSTRLQCRAWVDAALRRLEALALRTRERCAAIAADVQDTRQATNELGPQLRLEIQLLGAKLQALCDEREMQQRECADGKSVTI